jgi:hypothetical protein
VRGTFSPAYFEKARREGIAWCTPDVWEPFLRRVASTPDGFRSAQARPEYCVGDPNYVQFEFNALHRYPVIDLGRGRYVAPDTRLIMRRVSWGLFYDLFERDRTGFSDRFGAVFDRLVGDLLYSVCPPESLWSDAEWAAKPDRKDQRRLRKRGDWVYLGMERTVLFECKSLRPSLNLLQFGAQVDVDDLRRRVVSALEQVIAQSRDIQDGVWAAEGLPPAPTVCVLLSYGRFEAMNLPFFRDRVERMLKERGPEVPPFVVLSLEEFDTIIRLAELGKPIDRTLGTLATTRGTANLLQQFAPALAGTYVTSTYAHQRHVDFEEEFVP